MFLFLRVFDPFLRIAEESQSDIREKYWTAPVWSTCTHCPLVSHLFTATVGFLVFVFFWLDREVQRSAEEEEEEEEGRCH